MPFMPLDGVNMKAKPWPLTKFLMGAIEKMKEVANGRMVEDLTGLVGILLG